MKFYKEIKFCRICRKRYVVGNQKSYYCDDCQKKYKEDKKWKEQ